MTLHQLRISCHVCGAISSCFNRFTRIVLVSGTGMLLYKFVMSREAREWCGSSGVSLMFCSRSCVFLILKALGSGARRWVFSVKSFDSLYAGAFLQFTTGRIGWSGLCILIRPLKEGAEGFVFVYLHRVSLGIRVLLSLTVFSDLGLECVGRVGGCCAEFVIQYEVLYFGFVLWGG